MSDERLKRKISDLTPREQELLQQILDKLDRINNKLDRMIEKADAPADTAPKKIFYEGWLTTNDE